METFRRIEKKYLLDAGQYQRLMDGIREHVKDDKYPFSRISSLYYDNDRFELIRRSIEKPEYKEKLRVRCYQRPGKDDRVFVELKKKFQGVIYKRRSRAKLDDVLRNIYDCTFEDEQIGKEIGYMLKCYGRLKPKIYLSCDRHSYVAEDDSDLRITFDSDIRYRMDDLNMNASDKDRRLTDKVVMELKAKDALPLWLTGLLDEVKAYPQGFSKVGNAFLKELRGVN